jgi:hypothetical protein
MLVHVLSVWGNLEEEARFINQAACLSVHVQSVCREQVESS